MKKNLLTITMLVLCLMISITLVAVPASAQEIYCYGTQEVILIDDPYFEFTMKCEGESLWEMHIEGLNIGELGEVELFYWISSEDDMVEEGQLVLSSFLLKREVKTQVLTGDKLEVQFKFKPMP